MKMGLAILLSIIGTLSASYGIKYYSVRAMRAECESNLKEMVDQLTTVKTTYGTFKPGLSALKYRNIESCHIIESNSKFDELKPQFHDENYQFYFHIRGDHQQFGKVQSGQILYLE